MITGIGKSWCQVQDMARAIIFYRDTLGLNLRFESAHWTEFDVGSVTIALHSRLEGDGPCGDAGHGWYLGLMTDDVHALRDAVVAGGGVDLGFHDVPSGVVLTFTDPDGNPIQALQLGA